MRAGSGPAVDRSGPSAAYLVPVAGGQLAPLAAQLVPPTLPTDR